MKKHRNWRGDVEATLVWQDPYLRDYPEGGTPMESIVQEHMGALPRLHPKILEAAENPPIEPQTIAAEEALEAISEGCVGSLDIESHEDEPYSPPTDTPWGRESPAELGCELGSAWQERFK